MGLNAGQKAYVQNAGNMAFGKMKEDFDSSGMSVETAQEGAATQAGIDGSPESFEQPRIPGKGDEFANTPAEVRDNELIHEQSLRKGGYTHTANDLTKERIGLEINAESLKNKEQMYRAKVMRSGIQLVQAGDTKGGIEMMNSSLPAGQKVTGVTPLNNGKARVTSEDNPEGFVVVVDDMITAYTSAETQFKEKQANIRAKQRSMKADKENLPKIPPKVTPSEVKLYSGIYKKGSMDDIVPGLSGLSDGDRKRFTADVLDRANFYKEEARQQKRTISGDAARELAAQELQPNVRREPGDWSILGYGEDYYYGKEKKVDKPKDNSGISGGRSKKKVAASFDSDAGIIAAAMKKPQNKGKTEGDLRKELKEARAGR